MLQSKAGYIDARPLTASSANPLATHGRTIHRGHSRRFCDICATSALPLNSDIARCSWHVSKVPNSDIAGASRATEKPTEGGFQFQPFRCRSLVIYPGIFANF